MNDYSGAANSFWSAWKESVSENFFPGRYTITGTDVNHLAYDMANEAVVARRGFPAGTQGAVLIFRDSYGALDHRMARDKYGPDSIMAPRSYLPNPKAKHEISRVKPLEKEALKAIEQRLKRKDNPVGAIFLEPLLGAHSGNEHGMFFRTYFLLKLRLLADQYEVPIVVDEVMTGLRTGRPFAFQHNVGFTPDLITFGKAFGVSGLIETRYRNWAWEAARQGPTTVKHFAEPLLKGAQILKKIHRDKLFENAKLVEKWAMEKFGNDSKPGTKEWQKRDEEIREGGKRAIGNMWFNGKYSRGLPLLSLTPEELDQMFPSTLE